MFGGIVKTEQKPFHWDAAELKIAVNQPMALHLSSKRNIIQLPYFVFYKTIDSVNILTGEREMFYDFSHIEVH